MNSFLAADACCMVKRIPGKEPNLIARPEHVRAGFRAGQCGTALALRRESLFLQGGARTSRGGIYGQESFDSDSRSDRHDWK